MPHSSRLLVAALALLATAFAPVAPPAATPPAAAAPAAEAPAQGAGTGGSIVVLHDGADPVAAAARLLGPLGLQARHVYGTALTGFSVDAPATALAGLVDDPAVRYVEADREVRTAAQTVPSGVRRIDAVAAAGIGSQKQVPVDIAIIDTGIASHADLRVTERLDCTDRTVEPTVEYLQYLLNGSCKRGGTDQDGHGTHVAGIAAARDDGSGVVGVAPGARLWSVRVIRSTSGGSLTDVVAGVDEVARRADTIEVANISLVANGRSQAMDDAIAGARSKGVVVVVAAGNDARSLSNTTPANSPAAISVAAVTDLDGRAGARRSGSCHGTDDTFATYSNHGADIAAPGSCILSTARNGGFATKSGTSMAAPHVAGAAALRIHQRGLAATASRSKTVLDDLLSRSAKENSTCGYRGSPSSERLLDLRAGC